MTNSNQDESRMRNWAMLRQMGLCSIPRLAVWASSAGRTIPWAALRGELMRSGMDGEEADIEIWKCKLAIQGELPEAELHAAGERSSHKLFDRIFDLAS